MQKLINSEKKRKKRKNQIFLISRPISNYLPFERKKKFLEMVKKASEKFNFKIIIKLHLKEKHSDIFADVFGKHNYNKNWEFSEKHPFVIGSKCLFAVSFYSSVAVDLINIGVPCIELLDLKKLKNTIISFL